MEQTEKLTLSSRAFYNDRFPIFAEYLTTMFGYDMVLPMNTGAEGVETALKLARKWGYQKKKIPRDEVCSCLIAYCSKYHMYWIRSGHDALTLLLSEKGDDSVLWEFRNILCCLSFSP